METAKEVFVQLAYAIGEEYPVMATATIGNRVMDILDLYKKELTPRAIIRDLKLNEKCIFCKPACIKEQWEAK